MIFKKLIKILGPGFITGAADDDPSGIATYSQTGAIFGYLQLWTALFTIPFMIIIQETCGRVGMVTGKGFTAILKDNFAKPIVYGAVILLLIANTINIGADLGAMAGSTKLLINIPFPILLLGFTALTLILEVFVSYPTYARFLKYLTLSLFAYFFTAFAIKQDWIKIILSTVIPTISFNKEYLINIVAVLGTSISPYLFFWQADEEVEEEISEHKLRGMGKGIPRVRRMDIREMRLDTAVGMFFSQLVMFFIIITTASTLHANGITNINTADQAALALRPFAGNFAFLLFTAGIVGTGLLAVPILAGSAAYALSEMLNWNVGLSKKFKQAHGFYGIITVATLVGLFVNFTNIQPFQMLYYTAVVNGFAAPPLLVLIILIANDKKIMKGYTSSKLSYYLGWFITAIMAIASLFLLWVLIVK